MTNDGTGNVGTFQIIDELGDGLKTIDGENTLRFAVDGLNSGETRTFLARVFATRAGSFSSRAVAEAEGSELSARSARTTTEVIATDLDVQVDGPGRIYGRNLARFTAQVTNTGNTTAENVVVHVRWPADARLMDISDYRLQMTANAGQNQSNQNAEDNQQQPTPAQAGGQKSTQQAENRQPNEQSTEMREREMMIERLEPGQTAFFQYALRPINTEQINTEVEALHVCSLELVEGQESVARASAVATAQARLVRLPAMQLFVVDDEDPVVSGSNVTYTIRVINEGDAADQNVKMTATLPEGLTFATAKGPTEHEVNGSEITFQPIDTLEPGDSVDFQVVAANEGQGSVVFKASVGSESLDQEVIGEEPTRLVSKN